MISYFLKKSQMENFIFWAVTILNERISRFPAFYQVMFLKLVCLKYFANPRKTLRPESFFTKQQEQLFL